MWTRCVIWGLLGILLGGGAAAWAEAPPAAPAKPVSVGEPPPSGELEPDPLRSLNLTDLQRRILAKAFHQYDFETPPPPDEKATLGVRVEPTVPGGLYRMGAGGDLPPRLIVTIRKTGATEAVQLRYVAQNFYGLKVAEGTLPPLYPDQFGMATTDLVLKEANAFGYYHVLVTAGAEGKTATGACGLAVLQPLEAGASPGSPFGLEAPAGPMTAETLEVCHRLGVRHLAMDWTGDAAAFDAVSKAGLMPVPVVRFDLPQRDPEPGILIGTMGEVIQRRAEMLTDWRIGRRPVLGLDHLAESAESYRRVVSGLLTAVRRFEVPATLWVSATPETLADVLTEGPVMAGADGVSLYVDASAGATNLRSGAFRRSVDYGVQVARRMGVKRAAVGGTGDDPAVGTAQQKAWKIVTRHALAMAAGAERIFVTWDRGIPAPLPSAVAYAWMTHLLDGAAYEGEAWEDVPLLEAHLLSGPTRRVAVVWSWVGDDPAAPDRGALVFDNGLGLEALDVIGQPVGIWKDERLIVPLGEAPVFLVSGELKAGEMRDRLRKARILGVKPATIHIQSLIRGDLPGKVSVTLWVQSHRPYKQEGVAGLLLPEGWRARQSKQRFPLEAAQAREVTFECDTPDEPGPGPYPMEAVASLDEEYARAKQDVWPAQVVERTIEVGYGLSDWHGIAPVVLENKAGDIWAEVRTAWDKEFFYFAAAIRRQRATFKTGRYDFEGDAIQLGWNLVGRADDDFGHKTRDWALPSGAFRDTDHLVALTYTKDGPQVLRLRGPHMALRAHVPGNLDAWHGPVEGAVADIARDQAIGYTLVEAAIPMKALPPLRGERGRTFRFGFRIGQGEGRPLEWARVTGVPDFLANPASFLPTSLDDGLPCQTWWGMTGPRPGGPQP